MEKECFDKNSFTALAEKALVVLTRADEQVLSQGSRRLIQDKALFANHRNWQLFFLRRHAHELVFEWEPHQVTEY